MVVAQVRSPLRAPPPDASNSLLRKPNERSFAARLRDLLDSRARPSRPRRRYGSGVRFVRAHGRPQRTIRGTLDAAMRPSQNTQASRSTRRAEESFDRSVVRTSAAVRATPAPNIQA